MALVETPVAGIEAGEEFGTGFADVDEALLGADEKKWKLKKKDAYHITGVAEHKGCVTHVQDTLWKLRSWSGKELDKDQQRGISELADYYEPLLREACGIERKNRTFEKMVESALSTIDTNRAVLCVLCKMRYLIRPGVFAVLEAETYAQKVDAAVQVDEQLERALSDAEWWPQLREDHAAMIADPDAHRKVLKERRKSEKD